jgi:purine-binding chemotaxis protein CheW
MSTEAKSGRPHIAGKAHEGKPPLGAKTGKAPAGFSLDPTPAQKRQILRARAHALAQEDSQQHAPEESLRVIEFRLAHEKYAVEAAFVREVYQIKHLTPLPCTPPFVLGIVNIRGRILSIVDLRAFFALPHDGGLDHNTAIILRADALEFGVLTNGILGARSVPYSTIQDTLPALSGIRTEYLLGVTQDHTIILDAECILSDRRILVGQDELEL